MENERVREEETLAYADILYRTLKKSGHQFEKRITL